MSPLVTINKRVTTTAAVRTSAGLRTRLRVILGKPYFSIKIVRPKKGSRFRSHFPARQRSGRGPPRRRPTWFAPDPCRLVDSGPGGGRRATPAARWPDARRGAGSANISRGCAVGPSCHGAKTWHDGRHDRLRGVAGVVSFSSSDRLQVGDHVGHVLAGQLHLQPLGH